MRDTILNKVKGTVGYAEAADKKSFMTGAGVAFDKASEIYLEEIRILKIKAEQWENAYRVIYGDVSTLSTIIERYSQREN